jgi:hypothetical protein
MTSPPALPKISGGLEINNTPPKHVNPARISLFAIRSPKNKNAKITVRLGVR